MLIMVFAEGFEEIEAITAVDFLRRCGAEILTVSAAEERTVTGAHGIPIVCDEAYRSVDTAAVEGVLLPGGMPGTTNLGSSEWVRGVLEEVYGRGGLVAAICAAPSVLGALEMLRGRRATCYPGFEPALAGAALDARPAVRDGNVITSKAAGTAADFAYEIACYLGLAQQAAEVRGSMYYRQ